MNYLLSAEQSAFDDAVARFVRDVTPLPVVRQTLDDGLTFDRQVWSAIASDLGLPGLLVDEELSGAGAGARDMILAFGQLGAQLVPSPLLACTLAAAALTGCPDAAGRGLLTAIAEGEVVATVAVSEPGQSNGPWIPNEPSTVVAGGDDDVRVTGTKCRVLNAQDADVLLVLARRGAEDVLCVVSVDDPGVRIVPEGLIDLTRHQGTVDLVNARAVVLDVVVDLALRRTEVVADLAITAEQCGAMRACIDMASAYAKLRVAFGNPIGTYQAVKHALADAHCTWELSDAMLRDAASVADSSGMASLSALGAAASARALCSEGYFKVARTTIQVHGGLGYTWEHDAHLFYKNAMVGLSLLGDTRHRLLQIEAAAG